MGRSLPCLKSLNGVQKGSTFRFHHGIKVMAMGLNSSHLVFPIFQWIHLHESKSPPFYSSDCRYIMRMALRGLFVLLSHAHRTMLRMSTHSGSFLDCLPRGGRILPRRILMGATTMSHLYGFKTEREQYVWKKWRSFAFSSSA